MSDPRILTQEQLSIDQVYQAQEADADCWEEWLRSIHPDYREYMPYHRWLAWQLAEARKLIAEYQDTELQE